MALHKTRFEILFSKFHILLLLETWMKADTLISFEIPGYKSIVKCRSKSHSKAKRGSGGLIYYIKNEFIKGIQYREGKFKLEDRLWLEFNSEFFGLDKH